LTGSSTTDNSVSDLIEQLDNIPLIGPLIEAITGTTPGSPSGALSALSSYNVLGSSSGLNANNLYNQISSDLMGMVSVSHIGQMLEPPNLISDPNFTQLNSVGGSVFSQDATQSY